ncbi:MAG: response regulator [Candidatus Bathyarchaeia archaeon]|jgi:two-component system, chemotaxis family, chemotaxis protein CheY
MGRIQISDDALYTRELLKKIVKETKHELVAEATAGDEAIDLYRKVKPDLVLLDIVMPAGKSALNGMEALKQILEEDPSANVVICSALEQQVLIEEALRLGAKDFIAKPIMSERILEALSKYC